MPTTSFIKDYERYRKRLKKLKRTIYNCNFRLAHAMRRLDVMKHREPNQWYYFYKGGGKLVHCKEPMEVHSCKAFCRCKVCGKIISLKPYKEALYSPEKAEKARLYNEFRKSVIARKLKLGR